MQTSTATAIILVQCATHIVFVLHVDLPPVLTQPHRFLLSNLLILAIVSLIAQSSCRCEHERAGDDCCEEGEAEECERVLLQRFAVFGGDRIRKCCAEGFRRKLHRGDVRCRACCMNSWQLLDELESYKIRSMIRVSNDRPNRWSNYRSWQYRHGITRLMSSKSSATRLTLVTQHYHSTPPTSLTLDTQ